MSNQVARNNAPQGFLTSFSSDPPGGFFCHNRGLRLGPFMRTFLLRFGENVVIFASMWCSHPKCIQCFVPHSLWILARDFSRCQVIQFVTCFYPQVGGHQQPLKGSRFHHPKKVTSRIARNMNSSRDFCFMIWVVVPFQCQWPTKDLTNSLRFA